MNNKLAQLSRKNNGAEWMDKGFRIPRDDDVRSVKFPFPFAVFPKIVDTFSYCHFLGFISVEVSPSIDFGICYRTCPGNHLGNRGRHLAMISTCSATLSMGHLKPATCYLPPAFVFATSTSKATSPPSQKVISILKCCDGLSIARWNKSINNLAPNI